MVAHSGVGAARDVATRYAAVAPSHIPALDGLRGIAASLVLAYHFGVGLGSFGIALTRFGWCGVDLFFVLSGFLITGILYDSRGSEHYFRNFLVRRVLRIFPLYYLALGTTWLLAQWPATALFDVNGYVWVSLYLSNVAIADGGWLAIPEILSHYWSLSVEEHFYLVWPFLMLIGTRRQLMAIAAFLAVVAVSLRVWMVLTGVDATVMYVLTPTRMDSLAIGAFFGLAARGPAGAAPLLRPSALLVVVALVALVSLSLVRGTVSEYDPAIQIAGFSLVALVAGGLLIVVITWRPLGNLLSIQPLRLIGRYSYGLYVWHYLVYFYFFERDALSSALGVEGRAGALAYCVGALVITFGLSIASYHLYEKPFLTLKRRFPR